MRSRSHSCTWGLGWAAPTVRVPGSSCAPLPHGAVQRARRPALPSVRTPSQLRPAPSCPAPERPRPEPPRPRPAARPFRCGSGVSGRRRRHKLPRWRRAGGCERRSGRAGRGAEPGRRRADGAGAGGASRAPRTRDCGQGRPAGGRSAAADAHEVRVGQGQRGARAGAPPGRGAWAGAHPPGLGGGARGTPGRTQAALALWSRCPAGRGRRGPRAQSPGAAPGRARVCGAGVGGRAGAGSLCLFISNLIRTASGELRCLTGGRASIMQTAQRPRPPLVGGFCYFQNCGAPLPAVPFPCPLLAEDRPGQGQGWPWRGRSQRARPCGWWARCPAPRPLP